MATRKMFCYSCETYSQIPQADASPACQSCSSTFLEEITAPAARVPSPPRPTPASASAAAPGAAGIGAEFPAQLREMMMSIFPQLQAAAASAAMEAHAQAHAQAHAHAFGAAHPHAHAHATAHGAEEMDDHGEGEGEEHEEEFEDGEQHHCDCCNHEEEEEEEHHCDCCNHDEEEGEEEDHDHDEGDEEEGEDEEHDRAAAAAAAEGGYPFPGMAAAAAVAAPFPGMPAAGPFAGMAMGAQMGDMAGFAGMVSMMLPGLQGMLPMGGAMPVFFGGAGGAGGARMAAGDFVGSNAAFDRVLQRLFEEASSAGGVPPAKEEAIARLPTRLISHEEIVGGFDCAICKDAYEAGVSVKAMPCTHVFHPDCIVPWLRMHGSCPVCRAPLSQ